MSTVCYIVQYTEIMITIFCLKKKNLQMTYPSLDRTKSIRFLPGDFLFNVKINKKLKNIELTKSKKKKEQKRIWI